MNNNFSVLMSVHANENPCWLDLSLKSVWEDQTLKPDEIILVEDGPLPGSLLDVIDKWKETLEDKLILIINEENIGLTKSLNRGIKHIKSEYIARADSDDVSFPDRFEKQVAFLEAHPEIAVLGGTIEMINEFEQTVNTRYYPVTQKEVENSIYISSPVAHPAVMIRRAVFENGLKYDERYKRNQDIALWFDILAKGYKISNLTDIILKYRFLPNVYKRRRESIFNEFKIYIRGIYKMNGFFSVKYIYPVMRFIFRLLPVSFINKIYNSKIYANFFKLK
jgi:glycosyltransferase involved in cell wall biosynthesis